MDYLGDNAIAMIAGASGLVGGELLDQLINQSAIKQVHAVVRKPLDISHPKLHQHLDSDLRITQWSDQLPSPDIGFICLGTTIKQAGSKQALAHVDYDLVCQVAQTMKVLGVKRIVVVSSYGAKATSLSHYLRCKGKMEKAILTMGFERVVFVRPGPLAGRKHSIRRDEVFAHKILHIFEPLLIGRLKNFKPIYAADVANVMLFSALQTERSPADKYITLNSIQMREQLLGFDMKVHDDQ